MVLHKRMGKNNCIVQRIPDTPPKIAPLNAGVKRVVWSVMIPVYNCSEYISESIQSVLQQDPGADIMQIEVVDDGSTDADVEALVARIGNGRVSYYRQEKNVGSLRNFETCINRATGHYIHLLHGDDRVRVGFYNSLTALFLKYPKAGAAFCAYNFIDAQSNFQGHAEKETAQSGILENYLFTLAEKLYLQYVTIAVKREVYEKLGSFYGVIYGEDWEMWARIARDYPIAYTDEVLAEYRRHDNSISGNSFLTGQNVRDIQKVLNTINGYLPKERQQKASVAGRKNYSRIAMLTTYSIWHNTKNKKAVYAQLKEIVKMYSDRKIFAMIAQLLFIIQIEPLKRYIKKYVRKDVVKKKGIMILTFAINIGLL